MQRGYSELIKQVPLVKSLVEQGDVDALSALYRNVHFSATMIPVYLLILGHFSASQRVGHGSR
jgi:hypothetical protein